MWDELAACAWVEHGIITREKQVYMDVDLSHGPNYGDTLTWAEKMEPDTGVKLVHVQEDLNLPAFQKTLCGVDDRKQGLTLWYLQAVGSISALAFRLPSQRN